MRDRGLEGAFGLSHFPWKSREPPEGAGPRLYVPKPSAEAVSKPADMRTVVMGWSGKILALFRKRCVAIA